jgi:hypothetical protein
LNCANRPPVPSTSTSPVSNRSTHTFRHPGRHHDLVPALPVARLVQSQHGHRRRHVGQHLVRPTALHERDRFVGTTGYHRPGTATQTGSPDDHRNRSPHHLPYRRTVRRAAPRPAGRTPGPARRRRPRADHLAGVAPVPAAMATLRTYSSGNSRISQTRECTCKRRLVELVTKRTDPCADRRHRRAVDAQRRSGADFSYVFGAGFRQATRRARRCCRRTSLTALTALSAPVSTRHSPARSASRLMR